MVITDVHGDIEYVNPKFTQLTGYTLDEAIGQNPRILKSGMQSDAFYRRTMGHHPGWGRMAWRACQ